ncbi:MAG TPA: ester cyclase [Polyangia bacterium]
MITILRRQLEALGERDWKTYRSLFTDDAIYEEEPTQRRVQGPGAIVELVEKWTRAFPDLQATVQSAFAGGAGGDRLVAELKWEGTLRGPLEGPFGPVSPTGLRGTMPAVQVVCFEGERISEIRHYFDFLTLLVQAGVMPSLRAPEWPR